MNRRAREAFTLGLGGAVLGALVAVALHFRAVSRSGETAYHGRYVPMQGLESASPYQSTLDVTVIDSPARNWFPQLPIAIGIGLGLGLLVFGALVLTKRRIAVVSGSSPTG
jgi:hypothetical protein